MSGKGKSTKRKGPACPPDDKWRIPDVLWERIKPLLPRPKPHPLGCHNPAVDPRKVMDAIFFVLRTGCQWNALNATGLCSSSSAHRWFQVWTKAGVFKKLWKRSFAPGAKRRERSSTRSVSRPVAGSWRERIVG